MLKQSETDKKGGWCVYVRANMFGAKRLCEGDEHEDDGMR